MSLFFQVESPLLSEEVNTQPRRYGENKHRMKIVFMKHTEKKDTMKIFFFLRYWGNLELEIIVQLRHKALFFLEAHVQCCQS